MDDLYQTGFELGQLWAAEAAPEELAHLKSLQAALADGDIDTDFELPQAAFDAFEDFPEEDRQTALAGFAAGAGQIWRFALLRR